MLPHEESSTRTALCARGPQPIARAFHRYLHAIDDRGRASSLVGYVDTGMRLLVSILAVDFLGSGRGLPPASRALLGHKAATPSLGDWSRALAELARELPFEEWSLPRLAERFRGDTTLAFFLRELTEDRNRYFHRAVPGFVSDRDALDFLATHEPGVQQLSLALRALVAYPIVRIETNPRDDFGVRRATALRFSGATPTIIRSIEGFDSNVDTGVPLLIAPETRRLLRLDPFLAVEERGCETILRVVARVERDTWLYDDPSGGDASPLGPQSALVATLARTGSLPTATDRFRQTSVFTDDAATAVLNYRHTDPQHVEGYRLGKVLGHGGTSTVYLAERLLEGRMPERVALKVLHRSVIGEPTLLDRLAQEFSVLQRLHHPVTVRTYSYLPTEHVLVLEYVDGTDLHSFVTRTRPLPISDAARVCIQVLEALEEAHNAGIVHRDVKAANVMVENGSQRYRLLDFGLARWESAQTLTTAGDFFGTLAYIAPEQYKSAHDIDHRADLFSVGRLFQFLITGRLSDARNDVASAADALIRRATQQDREHRYQTARSMIEAFQERLNTSWTGQPLEPGEVLAQSFEVGALSGEARGVYAYHGTASDTGETISLLVGSTADAERDLLEAVRKLQPTVRSELGHPRVWREASKRAYVIATGTAEPSDVLNALFGGGALARRVESEIDSLPARVPPFLAWASKASRTWAEPGSIAPIEILQGAEYARRALVACCALMAARGGRLGLVRTRSDAVTETLGGALQFMGEMERIFEHESWWTETVRPALPAVRSLRWLARDRNLIAHGREEDTPDASKHAESVAAIVDLGSALADGFDWKLQARPVLVADATGGWHVLDIVRGHAEYLAITPGVLKFELSDAARAWLLDNEEHKLIPVEDARISWKFGVRSIPTGADDPVLADAPRPAFARYLAGLLVTLSGMPTVPPCGYSDAARAAGVSSVMAVFARLKEVQQWCREKGLFDLSAVVVATRSLEPGAGHFGADCADANEWQAYMRAAVAEIARRRAESTPSSST